MVKALLLFAAIVVGAGVIGFAIFMLIIMKWARESDKERRNELQY